VKARLVEWREIAPLTRNFVFDVPELEQVTFVPGQFLSFTAEINQKPITRAYSVASPPKGNRFELCLNRVEDGLFSPHLFDLKPGDTVETKGPYGAFHFRNPISDSILVATGTGVAPFRSMLQAKLPEDPSTNSRSFLASGMSMCCYTAMILRNLRAIIQISAFFPP
jgi:ferredoxin-NADP reductase